MISTKVNTEFHRVHLEIMTILNGEVQCTYTIPTDPARIVAIDRKYRVADLSVSPEELDELEQAEHLENAKDLEDTQHPTLQRHTSTQSRVTIVHTWLAQRPHKKGRRVGKRKGGCGRQGQADQVTYAGAVISDGGRYLVGSRSC